jgi:hypothetical protein
MTGLADHRPAKAFSQKLTYQPEPTPLDDQLKLSQFS